MRVTKILATAFIAMLFSSFIPINASETIHMKAVLTEADIKTAIDAGVKNKKHRFGLRLEDQTRNFFNAMANMNKPAWAMDEDKGFSLEAFTPTSWISECAAQATRQYLPFTMDTVTEEMRFPVLYLVVHGQHSKRMGTAGSASGGAMSGESVSHVVLRSEDKKIVVQPSKEVPFDEGDQNTFGAKSEFNGVKVEFPLEEVAKLRAASPDGEFFVTVVGENSEKSFKIKKKHFENLP